MKKKIITGCCILLSILVLTACNSEKAVGTIHGPENDYILYNDVTYVMDTTHNFSNNDRGEYLGKVTNDKITMKIYTIKGDNNLDYLYALWDWEGEMYVRQDLVDELKN